jgi:hypothetical protein
MATGLVEFVGAAKIAPPSTIPSCDWTEMSCSENVTVICFRPHPCQSRSIVPIKQSIETILAGGLNFGTAPDGLRTDGFLFTYYLSRSQNSSFSINTRSPMILFQQFILMAAIGRCKPSRINRDSAIHCCLRQNSSRFIRVQFVVKNPLRAAHPFRLRSTTAKNYLRSPANKSSTALARSTRYSSPLGCFVKATRM